MKNGRCPKCSSPELYAGWDVYPKIGPFAGNAIPISLLSVAPLDNYVCAECGYVERYIADRHKLREIADRWQPVKAKPESHSPQHARGKKDEAA